MVTGVSLLGADAALVLLQQRAAVYNPIALAITGNYNRLGSIDGIDEDANTILVLNYFLEKLGCGEFVIDQDYFAPERYPIKNLEQLLWGFERNMNDYENAAVLNGQRIVFALIYRGVWSAIAQSTPPTHESPTTQFRRLFEGVPIAEEIYQGNLAKVSRHLGELSAVSNFLASCGLAWKPAEEVGQHFTEEMRQFLEEARQGYRDSPSVLQALDDYERESRDLLEDD
jgi:hypothetical protein